MGFIYAVLTLYTAISRILYLYLDQKKLRNLYESTDKRPTTAQDAIIILNSLKTKGAKIQFINQLFEWLPREVKSEPIIEEAEKNTGDIRDLLSQLAESLEDSVKRKKLQS